MMRWTAVVLAGSRPGVDPFASAMGCDLKALIPVGGVAMVRRPVEALLASNRIGSVLVLAQQAERIAAVLPSDPHITVAESRGTIAETLLELCDDPATAWPLLVTTADHALLSPAMIDEFCSRTHGDVTIGMVEQRRYLRRFPDSRRTWLRFRGGAYSGANLFALRSSKVASALHAWRSVEQDRKKRFRLLWTLGPLLFVGTLLRLKTLPQVLQAIGRRLNLSIHPAELSDPVAAVDVDKQADLDLAERILAGRA